MSRRLSVLLGLTALVAILAMTPAIVPTQATGCATAESADFRYDDGRWLVLRAGGCSEGLHTYNQRWRHNTSIDVQYRINATYGSPDLYAFVPASEGGWWFVSMRGRAYRFSSKLQYKNRTETLPMDRDDYLTGVAIDEAGHWWIATNSETRVYDLGRNKTVQTFPQGATDILIQDGRVWRLTNGRKGGLVHEYVIRKNSGQLTLHRRATHELGPETFNPVLLSRGSDGRWWVYSSYRSAFAYDQNWQYTGERHPSSSIINGVFYLFPALLVSIVGLWILSWRVMMDYLPPRLLVIYLGSVSLAAPLAVSLRESLVPPSLVFLYGLPDRFVAILLFVPVVIGLYLLRKYSWTRLILIVAANLPLLVVAWDFLTSAG